MHTSWPKIDRLFAAMLALATGIIHLSIVPGDWKEAHLMGFTFFAMAAAFLLAAILLPATEDRRLDAGVVVIALLVSGLYVFMRMIPSNPLTHEKEHFEFLGNVSVAIQLGLAGMVGLSLRNRSRRMTSGVQLQEAA